MHCLACHRFIETSLASGAFVRCGCGALMEIVNTRDGRRAVSGVRTLAGLPPPPDPSPTCACGDESPFASRRCARCNKPRPCVRCPRCVALVALGADRCASCGGTLDLEPLLLPTPMPCPRCRGTLSTLSLPDGTAEECERCGGIFTSATLLHALIEARRPSRGGPTEKGWPPLPAPTSSTFPPPPLESVVYIPCPVCRKAMNRRSFGRRSTVVIDTCKLHGTWFDAGKLTAALAFVARGGLEMPHSAEWVSAPDVQAPASVRPKGRVS